MIAITDYDAGDLRSVEKALLSLEETSITTRGRKTVPKADKVILPGVGSFGDAMEKLKQYDLVDVIYETVDQGIPFLDICLGLQLSFAGNEENHGAAGLGILPEKILKIPEHPGLKTPHMGWNLLKIRPEVGLFHGIKDRACVYFAHSYYLEAEGESVVTASIEYSIIIYASVERGNVFAHQFYPEKNGKMGPVILKNLTKL